MEKLNFVALDFEYVTVKGDQYPKHVTQVGIVRVENGAIVERYCTYVKPLCSKKEFDKDFHAKRKTGIKYGMLEDKPTFVELWDSLFDKLNGNLVVVHNASTADLPALTNELERNNISRSGSMWPMFDCICTYKIGGCKLEKLCELYNVVNETTHDACCDADATARVVIAMRNEERFFALSDLEKIHYDCTYVSARKKEERKMIDASYWDERELEQQEQICIQTCWEVLHSLEDDSLPRICLTDTANNPFVGKRVCVTGDLIRLRIWRGIPHRHDIQKSEVIKFLEEAQAEVQGNVKRDTDLLLVLAYRSYDDNHESTKHARAKQYKNKGQAIQIMLLEEFMKLIEFV